MEKLRVAIFIDGSGEPLAAEISRGLNSIGIECEAFLFSLSSLLVPTQDFLDALKSLALSHALIIPHSISSWDQRSTGLFKECWRFLNKLSVHVVQATIPLPLNKFSGMFEQDEEGLYRKLKKYNDYFFSHTKTELIQIADIDRLSSEYGRSRWFDSRAWEIAGIPASIEGIHELGIYLTKVISSSQGDVVKMVVVDLDQILWPEILDEVTPEGILQSSSSRLFLNFQNYLLEIKNRGILLSILSSNQPESVFMVFDQCSKLLLGLEDFVHIELGWENKVHGMLKISEITKIHPSHMLFIDDSKVNQDLMKKFIPQMKVLDATTDPVHNIEELNRKNYFEGHFFTDADRIRSQSSAPSQDQLGQFLLDRNPELEIRKATTDDITRIVQLHQRTNQFNARHRRASSSEVKSSLDQTLVLSFRDQDQNYGLIGVVELKQVPEVVIIFDWLLSCRVFSRSIEEAFICWLRDRKSLKSKKIHGELIPMDRNSFIHQLYHRLGFALVAGDNCQTWIDAKSEYHSPILKIIDLTGIP